MTYPIHSIFRTLQGEGRWTGHPAVFVRLAGCSLWGSGKCYLGADCDTEPTRMSHRHDAAGIVSEVQRLARDGIVVLTGGEPTDYDLAPLVRGLDGAGYSVHLETSGQRAMEPAAFSGWFRWVTVSPKSPDYQQRQGHALKVVVLPGMRWVDVAQYDVDFGFAERFLQPMTGPDGKPVNLPAVLEMLLDERMNPSGRWSLSTQAHRTWGIE